MPVPENGTQKFKDLFIAHQKLMQLLCDHTAMDPNRQQTYSTPANSKNKVYSMWDFVGRTLAFLSNEGNVNPAQPRGEVWQDCLGRGMMAKMLMLDTTGKLEQMNKATGYNDDAGVEFTEEIKEWARKFG